MRKEHLRLDIHYQLQVLSPNPHDICPSSQTWKQVPGNASQTQKATGH